MAQNVYNYYKGQLFFLGGVGLALTGSAFVFLLPAVYYIAVMVGLSVSLYGAFYVLIPGVMTGTDYAAAKLLGASGLFVLAGIGIYLVPFAFGWPIYTPVGFGQVSYFGPSLTLLYNGLLLVGLSLLAGALLIPETIRQWRMTPEELSKKKHGVRSYSAIMAAYEPPKEPDEQG